MKRGAFFILLAIVLMTKVFVSCMTDENFSASPQDRLTFSVDTVRFDTVISGQGTHTVAFSVYNWNKNGIRIARVWKAQGESSPFRVSVGAVYIADDMPTDFRVASGDSLKVFLEMTAPVSGQAVPQEVTDHLCFQLESGAVQEVVMQAYGQDVDTRRGGWVIDSDTTLSPRIPYQIYDSLVVAENVTLKLEPGTRFYFHNGAKFIVHGTLLAEGAVNNPIVMRGDRLGNIFTNQAYDQLPGQWEGVTFSGESYGNHLNYCDIHGTSTGVVCDSSDISIEKIRIENSILHNTNGNCLQLVHCKSFVGNTQLTNARSNCVMLVGGDHQFVHCTIGSFYGFDLRDGVALYFTNYHDGVEVPLYRAEFYNCIITGLSDDELLGESSDNEACAFNYYFASCLLDTPQFEDENVTDCLWDTEDNPVCRDQNFQFDVDRLNYSFQLDSLSIARGTADPVISQQYYPADRSGVERSGAPDMGCYQSIYTQAADTYARKK